MYYDYTDNYHVIVSDGIDPTLARPGNRILELYGASFTLMNWCWAGDYHSLRESTNCYSPPLLLLLLLLLASSTYSQHRPSHHHLPPTSPLSPHFSSTRSNSHYPTHDNLQRENVWRTFKFTNRTARLSIVLGVLVPLGVFQICQQQDVRSHSFSRCLPPFDRLVVHQWLTF